MYGQDFNKPVKEGDVIEVAIEGTGAKGDGIARINGFVIVVPGGKEGETIKVKITRVLRKMAFAELSSEEINAEVSQEEPAHEETTSQEEEPAHEEADSQEEQSTEEIPSEE
jgi:predicted RNA-binding protein with TRAM domain